MRLAPQGYDWPVDKGRLMGDPKFHKFLTPSFQIVTPNCTRRSAPMLGAQKKPTEVGFFLLAKLVIDLCANTSLGTRATGTTVNK